MAEERPTTPQRSEDSSNREDNFEDADDMTTPRPRARSSSPEATRSLTDRRGSTPSDYPKEKRDDEAPPIPQDGDKSSHLEAKPGHKQTDSQAGQRISVTSMDDVILDEDSHNAPSHSRTTTRSSIHVSPRRPSHPDTSAHTTQGLSGPMAIPNIPPPAHPESAPQPSPTPSVSRFRSPFSWLSRATGGTDKNQSHPLPSPPHNASHARRGTMSSIASGNTDLMLSKIEEGEDQDGGSQQRNSRSSLRDRFKLLRMREEAGVEISEDATTNGAPAGGAFVGLISRSASIGFGIGSPIAVTEQEKEEEVHTKPPLMERGASSPGLPPLKRQATINKDLPPGTASGMVSAPPAAPVDWDLWQSVVYEGPAAVARTSPEELAEAIASGIPQAIRGVVWQVLAKSQNEELEKLYHELVARGTDKEKIPQVNGHHHAPSFGESSKERESVMSEASSTHSQHSTPASTPGILSDEETASLHENLKIVRSRSGKDDVSKIQKLEKVIKRDLGARTSYSKYIMSAGLQDGLFGICKAYALYDEDVGYAQGMNFIAMPLLFNMPEEEAFCLFVRLMSKYRLRELFIHDMPGLHLHLYQFERLLEDLEPALYCHLNRRDVHPRLYATQWFLTLFAYRFPLQLVLRVYDLVLSEGLEGSILKFGIALMKKNRDALLAMKDMSHLTTFLKEKLFDVYIDKAPSANSILESGFFGSTGGVDKEVYRADMLVQDACAVNVTPEALKAYAVEWEEKTRQEKERQHELDHLRSQNQILAHRIRSMEERAERSDMDHVQVASELVRTKVDNEALQDENESLRGQVDELKNVVQRQTEEVEARLRGEMDTVMQRNIEVQNLNRGLEEEKEEMEKALVEAKMAYAQVNSEYETLKQKWNNITQILTTK